MAEHVTRLHRQHPRGDAGGVGPERRLLGRRKLLNPRHLPGARVYETVCRIECDWDGVCPPRRPDLDLLASEKALIEIGEDRPASRRVDMGSPVDLDVRMSRNQLAVRTIEHV